MAYTKHNIEKDIARIRNFRAWVWSKTRQINSLKIEDYLREDISQAVIDIDNGLEHLLPQLETIADDMNAITKTSCKRQ